MLSLDISHPAISEINSGYWFGNESAGNQFSVYVNFTNVTEFSEIELVHRYSSDSGVPSTHVLDWLIWCNTHNEWIKFREFKNENYWYMNLVDIAEKSHVVSNGTIRLKYDHASNGNVNHRLWIDSVRLVKHNISINQT